MRALGLLAGAALFVALFAWLVGGEAPPPDVDVLDAAPVADAAVDAAPPVVPGHAGWITGLYVRDGHLYSGDADGVVVAWSLGARRAVRRWTAHTGAVRSLWTSKDSVFTAGRDGTVAEWDTGGRPQMRLRLPSRYLNAAGPAPNGAVVAADAGHVARLGPAAAEKRPVATWVLQTHETDALGLAVSPDGAVVASGGHDGEIRLARVADGTELRRIPAHDAWVTALAWSGSTLFSAAYDGRVRGWDPETGARTLDLAAHERPVVALAVDANHILTGSEDNTARLHTRAGQRVATLSGPDLPVEAVALSGEAAFTGTRDGAPRMWQTDGVLLHTFPAAP